MTLSLPALAVAIGSVDLPPALQIDGWSTDSRTVQPGDLFFALDGGHHDGHAHAAAALAQGAAAAVVHREVAGAPLLRVSDTLAALQDAARFALSLWGGTVVGVTGSAGKTTTKDVIAHLLSTSVRTGKTQGNFNNHVGLPLSILRLPDGAQAAVLEYGMNHAGEIRQLATIAPPELAVVTNVGSAHIENFTGVQGIALAKRELVEALPPDGTAILNEDDPFVREFRDIHAGPVISFGFSETADVHAEAVHSTAEGTEFAVDGLRLRTRLAGAHGVRNILAGLAVARCWGIPAGRLVEAVADLPVGKMRGERSTWQGITIWNDTYNANPDAVRAMIAVLAETPARRRIAVLGEMRELGTWSEQLHREVGAAAAQAHIDELVGVTGDARFILDGAHQEGFPAAAAHFYEDPADAGRALRGLAREGDAILFKGSRGTRVERALEAFLA